MLCWCVCQYFFGGGFHDVLTHEQEWTRHNVFNHSVFLCVHYRWGPNYCHSITDVDQIVTSVEDPFVSSLRISWSSSGFPDPLNPIFTGTSGISAFYGRYQWHQSISLYHLLYSNLIPQHPVPPAFTGSRPRRLPTTFLEDCPLYFRNSFLFISHWLGWIFIATALSTSSSR